MDRKQVINQKITELIMANEAEEIVAMTTVYVGKTGNIKILEAYDDSTIIGMNIAIDIAKQQLMTRVMNNSIQEVPNRRN